MNKLITPKKSINRKKNLTQYEQINYTKKSINRKKI